jgi:2-iminobutanoate/2-iminopropanoate deaminase
MPSSHQPVYLPNPDGVAPPPGNVFSHAVIVGDTVYASGQNGIDSTGMLVDGFEDQVVQAFENLQVVLRAAGSGLENVVKIQVLVAEPHDVRAYLKLRERYLPQRPASTLYAVKGFAMPGLLVEIDVTAVRAK